MPIDLSCFLSDFADALETIDRSRVAYKHFQPGIGPFGEGDAVRAAVQQMKAAYPDRYIKAEIRRMPDLLIPGDWAIEFKIIRPFGDNGRPAEHWSENILHPYAGNTSSLGDCMKLLESGLDERKAIVVFGFEHSTPQIPLDPAVNSFELLARHIIGLSLSQRYEERRNNLIHPVHQVLRIFGWEVLGLVKEEIAPVQSNLRER